MVKKVSRETKSTKKLPSIQLFLDVSSSNSGVVILLNENQVLLDNLNLSKIKKPPCMKQEDFQKVKMGIMKEYFDKLKREYTITSVYMEGIYIQPKFLKSSTMLLKIHGFLMGYFLDTPQYFVPPAVIKKTITGKGNANKEEIRGVMEDYYGITFSDSDISDAFALMLSQLGYQDYEISQKQGGNN